ncbi:MAG: hypothetical protein ACK5Q5_20455 [Planctomycetaceae bacterium]
MPSCSVDSTRLAWISVTVLAWLLTSSIVFAQSSTQRFGGPRRPTPATDSGKSKPAKSAPLVPSRTPPPSFGAQLEKVERSTPRNIKTFVEFTVLTPVIGGSLDGQRWAKLLSELGVEAQFRGPTGGDELGVEETVRGTLRTVRVTGQLGGDGRLRIANTVYTTDNAKRLQEWLNELQLYGAQGAPAGQPLWGLTEPQFTTIFEALAQPVEADLEGLPLSDALAKLPLPAAHPLRNSSDADAWLATHPGSKIENQTQGLSCGTVLATILNEAGLGFYPVRTPTGQIDLSIIPLGQQQVWPIGWELGDDVDHGQLVPVLHKFAEIGFDKAALQDVLDATAAAIDTPILVDSAGVRAAGVDLADKAVSYPPKRTTWSLMLNTVIRKANLVKEVRTDELGKPMLLVTPFVPTPVEPTR